VELWAAEDFEMIAVEVKSKDAEFTLEIAGTYRTPNEDMRAIKKLCRNCACMTLFT
jgi:hypothetical protein